MIGWIILGAITVFLTALMLLPLRLCFTYCEETEFVLRVGFVPIRILPAPEKQTHQKPPKPKKEKKKTTDAAKKPNFFKQLHQSGGISGLLAFFKEVIRLVARLSGGVTRRLVLEQFDLYMCVAAGDAAQTAEQYGKACAVVYPAAEALCRIMKNKKRQTEISANYFAEKTVIRCKVRIRIYVGTLVYRALQAALGFVKLLFCQLIRNKKAALPEPTQKGSGQKCPDSTLKT